MAKSINAIPARDSNLEWLNILNAGRKEIEYLKRKFKFNQLDLADAQASKYAQRPKFFVRNNYCFLILQFPFYNTTTKAIEAEEIDFFIGNDFIITIHQDKLPPLTELYNLCAANSFYRSQYLNNSGSSLLYEIIYRLQEYCYPIMDHISLDIKTIERSIFAGHERKMVTEILSIKRNILNFRRIMQAHKNVIQKIIKEKINFLPMNNEGAYYSELIEKTKDIWDNLNEQREMIEALEATNTSLVSFKLNDIMRTLTIFSVIVFPLTLLATIFSMKVEGGMPFINAANGFWLIIILMVLIGLAMIFYFKKRKWL